MKAATQAIGWHGPTHPMIYYVKFLHIHISASPYNVVERGTMRKAVLAAPVVTDVMMLTAAKLLFARKANA